MTVHIKASIRDDRAQLIIDAIDAGSGPGKLRIYGDAQATNADTAVGSQTLLLELVLQDPCGTANGSGVVTFDVTPTITDDALATDTATWGRFLDSDNNVVLDGTVGTDITLTDTTLDSGQTAVLASVTLTEAV